MSMVTKWCCLSLVVTLVCGGSDKRCPGNFTAGVAVNGYASNDVPKELGSVFSILPPFILQESPDPICRDHSRIFSQQLENFNLWALQMYDASAKLPSGLLNGNVNQLGDFDQCLAVKQPDGEVRGQYCLASIEIKPKKDFNRNPSLLTLHDLVHSHSAFRSDLEDPGHRIPRFSSINWALCVPESCSPKDVENTLSDTLNQYLSTTGMNLRVKVDQEMCQVQSKSIIPPYSSLVVFFVFAVLLGIIATATSLHYFMPPEVFASKKMELLLTFSVLKNSKALFSLERTRDDIECVHGIRAVNAFMLLVSHKSMAMFFNPYTNRTAMTEMLGKPWTVVARAASLYTDPFIMLSGLLTSYVFLKQLNNGQSINIPKVYISRLLRIVPTLGALILFCTFILPFLGSGPQWNLVVNHHAEICKTAWWRNMLFIHNYFGFKNMCLTHTHHIGIDTQLFAISPFLAWLVWKWPRNGFFALLALAIFSTMLRFYATFVRQLNLFVYFGNPVSQMFETADYSYILPTHRLTVYVMGVGLGYILQYCGRNYKLKTGHLTVGWFFALCMLYQSIVSPAKMGGLGYVYDRLDAANYAAFAPITFCLFFSWIIFTSHTGNGGLLARIFSWRGFLVCTRLSYTFYLTQFPVFFYNVGQTRSAEQYSILKLFNVKETAVIIISSIVLTLFVEIPFQNIREIIFKKSTQERKLTKKEHLN